MNKTILAVQLNNRGRLRGKLVQELSGKFEVEGEVFYEGKIEVSRLSDVTDVLPFTISEKILKAYNLSLKPGDEIGFVGELRSYNRVIEGKK